MKLLLALVGGLLVIGGSVGATVAGPFWQSDLTCDFDGDGVYGDEGPARPLATIKFPSGDLYVSVIRMGPGNANTPFACHITCMATGASHTAFCGMADGYGTLGPHIVADFATQANLGPICRDFIVEVLNPSDYPICQEGFRLRS